MRAQRRYIGVNESGRDEEGSNVESVTRCQVFERNVVPDVRIVVPAGHSIPQHELVPVGGLSREPGDHSMSLSRQSERFARAPCTHVYAMCSLRPCMVNVVICEAVRMIPGRLLSPVASPILR